MGSSGSSLVHELIDRVAKPHMGEDTFSLLYVQNPKTMSFAKNVIEEGGEKYWVFKMSEREISRNFTQDIGEPDRLYFKATNYRRNISKSVGLGPSTDEECDALLNSVVDKMHGESSSCRRWTLFTTRDSRRENLKLSGFIRGEPRILSGPAVPVGSFSRLTESGEKTAWFPYVNGFLRGLINLNQISDYLKQIGVGSGDNNEFCLLSPGSFSISIDAF